MYCRNINLVDLKSDEGYEHQPTFAALHQSSLICDMCHLIIQAVDKAMNGNDDNAGPVKLISGLIPAQRGEYENGNLSAGSRQTMGKVAITIGRNVSRSLAFSIRGARLDMFTVKGRHVPAS
jgi:hypothetical protein